MKNAEIYDLRATELYVAVVRKQVQKQYPGFRFEKGAILYDMENEMYVYRGFDDDEIRIINDVVRSMAA